MLALEGIRILLVEDNDDTREVTRMALEMRGAVVTSASSAALAVVSLQEAPPDVVVSDIAMPEEDGHSFLKSLKAYNKKTGGRIPAVALTASSTRDERVKSRESGFHYHLTKPVDHDQLAEIVMGLVRLTRR